MNYLELGSDQDSGEDEKRDQIKKLDDGESNQIENGMLEDNLNSTKDNINKSNLESYHRQYRTNLRSKVLQRIYDKSQILSDEGSSVIDDNLNQPNKFDGQPEDSSKKLDQKLKRHFLDEWNKTLERVLDYQTENFRKRLEIGRKSGLEFFLRHRFDSDDEVGDGVGQKTKKHKRKKALKSKFNVRYVGNRIKSKDQLVKRKKKAKEDVEEKLDTKIIADGGDLIENAEDRAMVLENCHRFGYQQSSRLFREQFNLERLNDQRLFNRIENYFERCSVKVPIDLFEENQTKSTMFKNFSSTSTLSSVLTNLSLMNLDQPKSIVNSPSSSTTINNNRLILAINLSQLSFIEHPAMNNQQRLFRKLRSIYSQYCLLNSAESKNELKRIETQIDSVMKSLVENESDNDTNRMKEYRMDCNLLKRLLNERNTMVENRRKTLIELLKCWSLIEQDLDVDREQRHQSSSQIDLILEEEEISDDLSQSEKEQFTRLSDRLEQAKKFMAKLLKDREEIENTKINNIYLDDGRLPGEPKFSKLELIIPKKRNSIERIDNSLSEKSTSQKSPGKRQQLFYTVQISLAERQFGNFGPIRLDHSDHDRFDLNLNQSPSNIVRIPIPTSTILMESESIGNHSQYRPLNIDKYPNEDLEEEEEEEGFSRNFPTISIFESTNNSEQSSKRLFYKFQISGNELPDFQRKNLQQAKPVEKSFEFDSKSMTEKSKKKNKHRVSGSIRYSLFWSSIPSAVIDGSNLSIFDQDIRKIKTLTNIEQIDQWLHDIRYSMVADSSTGDGSFESLQPSLSSNKNLQLLELLLRRKYQLELENLTTTTAAAVKESKENISQSQVAPPDGTFCTDEDIESNKLFQLMIQRNQGRRQYSHYRFIPLNPGELLPTILHDTSEKLSLDILLDFVRKSCQLQRTRLVINERRRRNAFGDSQQTEENEENEESEEDSTGDESDEDKDEKKSQQKKRDKKKSPKKKMKKKNKEKKKDKTKDEEETIALEDERESMLAIVNHDWCFPKQSTKYSMNWMRTAINVWDRINNDDNQWAQMDEVADQETDYTRSNITSVKQMLTEIMVDSFSTAGFALFPMLGTLASHFDTSHGKLNPSRKDRRKSAITLSDALIRDSIEIVLVIQQASNVPVKLSGSEQSPLNSSSSSSSSSEAASSSDDGHEDNSKNVDTKRDKRRKERNDRGLRRPGFSPCSTVVEIKLDNSQQTTAVSDGSQPTWNENFKFQTKFDPTKQIHITLFEVDTDSSTAITTAAVPNTTTTIPDSSSNHLPTGSESDEDSITNYQNVSQLSSSTPSLHFNRKRWLGQLSIPLHSLLGHSKIEGTFSLQSPYFLSGYRNTANGPSHTHQHQSQASGKASRKLSSSKFTINRLLTTVQQAQSLQSSAATDSSSSFDCIGPISLSLFVLADPPIELISTVSKFNASPDIESKPLIDHCHRWTTSLTAHFPSGRHFLSLVHNLKRQSVLACRFLSPIKPPELSELLPVVEDQDPTQGSIDTEGRSSTTSPQSSSKRFLNRLKRLVHKDILYLNLVIRYVSLFPSLSGSDSSDTFGQSRTQIWFDSYQMLTFRAGFGSDSGQAILLCCFLLHLGRDVALVIGEDLLKGTTTRVILFPGRARDEEEDEESDELDRSGLRRSPLPVIIDAQTGLKFNVSDPKITMTGVHCIVTPDNIYANIQKQTHPNRVQFSLRKSSHWTPLFGEKDYVRLFPSQETQRVTVGQLTFSRIESIEPDRIRLPSVNRDAASSLEFRLEHYLREQFVHWRRQLTGSYTAFNRHCTQIVKRLLPLLEHHQCLAQSATRNPDRYRPGRTLPPDPDSQYRTMMDQLEVRFMQQLQEVYDVHQIIGYPLQVRHTDFETIALLVQSIGLHGYRHTPQADLIEPGLVSSSTDRSLVEFVICCHVQPYPANLYSIWIYLAALLPKISV